MLAKQAAGDILIIGDAWPNLDHPRDSSLYLAGFVSQSYHCRVFWAEPANVFFDLDEARVTLSGEIINGELVAIEGAATRPLPSFHSLHWRTDPPVELQALRLWGWLSDANIPPMFNSPRALLTWNEKFAPLRYTGWSIPSLVSDAEDSWKLFFDRIAEKTPRIDIIAKPAGDAASRGVRVLSRDWNAARRELHAIRAASGPWLILQSFDTNIFTEGETRIFVIGGEICSALNKRPHPKHAIMDMDAPEQERPQLALCTPSPVQLFRAGRIGADLQHDGVILATIDFIGEHILEINVTSAGLIRWLDERLPDDRKLAERYWKKVFSVSSNRDQ